METRDNQGKGLEERARLVRCLKLVATIILQGERESRYCRDHTGGQEGKAGGEEARCKAGGKAGDMAGSKAGGEGGRRCSTAE